MYLAWSSSLPFSWDGHITHLMADCPYHLSLASLTFDLNGSKWLVPRIYQFSIMSNLVTPGDNLSIRSSTTSSAFSWLFSRAAASKAYISLVVSTRGRYVDNTVGESPPTKGFDQFNLPKSWIYCDFLWDMTVAEYVMCGPIFHFWAIIVLRPFMYSRVFSLQSIRYYLANIYGYPK